MASPKFLAKQSDILNHIKPSGIRKMFSRAQGLDNVISLGIGMPDLPPPQGLLDEIKNELTNLQAHGYTLNSGIPLLREKICEKYEKEYQLNYSPADVVVGVGATELLYSTIYAYTNPGDEVLVPDPGFVYYPTIPLMAGCNVKSIALDNEFQMPVEIIQETISEKSKLIILNTPGNPTGGMLENSNLKAIAEIAIDNDLIILSDEVYEYITFDGRKHASMAEYAPENTIILNSFSKSMCITGWRLGYALASDDLITPLSKLHPFIVANPPSLPQYAIGKFMGTREDLDFQKQLQGTMEKRRDVTVSEFSKIPGVKVPEIKGSFYAFPEIDSDAYNNLNPGETFAEDIFDNTQVVMVAGSEFGTSRNNHFRVSFGSASEELIKESASRIIRYLE